MNVLAFLTILGFAFAQLGAIPFGPTITLYVHDILLVCLLVFAVLTKKITSHGVLIVPLRLFVSIAVASLLFNAYQFGVGELAVSSLYLWRWVLYSSLYVLTLQPVISARQWLTWTYWSGVGVAIFGLVQYVLYNDLRNLFYLGWDPHYYRVFSTFFDPNYLSLYLVLTIFLGISLSHTKARWYFVAGQLVTFSALLLTYSRSGYIALVVGLFVYALFQHKLKAMLIGLCVLIAILFMLPKPAGEGVKLFRTTSTLARVGNWQRGFMLIQESPWVGFGFNTLRIVQERKGWVDLESGIPSKAGAGLDDSFQFLWATTGVVGLLTYLWILMRVGKLFLGLLGNNATRILGVVGLSGLFATVVHSQFINSLFYPQILAWWWIVTGATEQFIMEGRSLDVRSSFDFPRHQSRQSKARSPRRSRLTHR